jgi:hypothetical protein
MTTHLLRYFEMNFSRDYSAHCTLHEIVVDTCILQYEVLGVGTDNEACLDRAQQFWIWCGNNVHEPIFVTYVPTGQQSSYPPEIEAIKVQCDPSFTSEEVTQSSCLTPLPQPMFLPPLQPSRFASRPLGAWQSLLDPGMLPLSWGGARAQQVALSHEYNMDFGAVLYAWDDWLIFIDAAGPVCLTAGFFSANIDTCHRADGSESFMLEVDGVVVFVASVEDIFYKGIPELPRPLSRATVDGSWCDTHVLRAASLNANLETLLCVRRAA